MVILISRTRLWFLWNHITVCNFSLKGAVCFNLENRTHTCYNCLISQWYQTLKQKLQTWVMSTIFSTNFFILFFIYFKYYFTFESKNSHSNRRQASLLTSQGYNFSNRPWNLVPQKQTGIFLCGSGNICFKLILINSSDLTW